MSGPTLRSLIVLGALTVTLAAQSPETILAGAPPPRPTFWGIGERIVRQEIMEPDARDTLDPAVATWWDRVLHRDAPTEEFVSHLHSPIAVPGEPTLGLVELDHRAFPASGEANDQAWARAMPVRRLSLDFHEATSPINTPSPLSSHPPHLEFRAELNLRAFAQWPEVEMGIARFVGVEPRRFQNLSMVHTVWQRYRSWPAPDLGMVMTLDFARRQLCNTVHGFVRDFEIEESELRAFDEMLADLAEPLRFPERDFMRLRHWIVGWLESPATREAMLESLTPEGVRERMEQSQRESRDIRDAMGDPLMPLASSKKWDAFGAAMREAHLRAVRDPEALRTEADRVLASLYADWVRAFQAPWRCESDWRLADQTQNPIILEAAHSWVGAFRPISAEAEQWATTQAHLACTRALVALARGQEERARGFIDPFSQAPVIVAEDHIRSVGPDGIDQAGDIVFDPTNGVGSGGDIVISREPTGLRRESGWWMDWMPEESE